MDDPPRTLRRCVAARDFTETHPARSGKRWAIARSGWRRIPVGWSRTGRERGSGMLPTAELHIHIEGTLEPEMLVRLAARNGGTPPTTDLVELRARYRFADLQSLL